MHRCQHFFLQVIFALAGKDVTEDFEDIGHSDVAREWTDDLSVGRFFLMIVLCLLHSMFT